MRIFFFIIAMTWTFIIVQSLASTYKTHIKFGWFKYRGLVLAFISYSLAHFAVGYTIWTTVWIETRLSLGQFITFIGLGILFYIISFIAKNSADKEVIGDLCDNIKGKLNENIK